MVSKPSQFIDPGLPKPAPGFAGRRPNLDSAVLFLLVLVLSITGVAVGFIVVMPSWRPIANMEKQAYFKPYEPTEVFADGMSERPLLTGVVPRPADQSPGVPYVAVRESGPANYPVVARSDHIPFPITRQLLERGQQQFSIYCEMCHGRTGKGNGMIVQRGFYPPPSYHNQRLRNIADSHFFDVITNGYGAMFPYSDRVSPDDRWAITAYIRALQVAVAQSPELSQQLQKPRGVLAP